MLNERAKKKSESSIVEFIVQSLVDCGVTHVFGGHGGAVVPLVNAIVAHPKLTWVYMRCEVNASLAAMAYAKLHGRLGVCVGTSGPGASHLLTGLIDANQDRVPVLAITGQKELGKLHYTDFQDINQDAIFKMAGLQYSESIASAKQCLPLLRDGVSTAISKRCAVHLCIPCDVQKEHILCPDVFCARNTAERYESIGCNIETITKFALYLSREIEAERNCLICIGPRAVKHAKLILELAEMLNLPILTTMDAKGLIKEDHPLSMGLLGVYGNPGMKTARNVLDACTTVITFGLVDHTEVLTNTHGLQARRYVQFDKSPMVAETRFQPLFSIFGKISDNIQSTMSVLRRSKNLTKQVNPAYTCDLAMKPSTYVVDPEHLSDNYCHPGRFFKLLGPKLTGNTTVCIDVGDIALWVGISLALTKPNMRVLTSEHMGTMGFGLNSTIAASLSTDKHVIMVAGDGGFQMSCNELATLAQHKEEGKKVLLIVIQNNRLGRVQNEKWGEGDEAHGCHIVTPDFVQFAKAYGCKGVSLSSSDESVITETIEDCLNHPGICLLALHQDPEIKPIMFKKDPPPESDESYLAQRRGIYISTMSPELPQLCIFEAQSNPQFKMTYHGDVKYIIKGVAKDEYKTTKVECQSFRYGFEAGSPRDVQSIGDAVAVNGTMFCRSTDQDSPDFYKTILGPDLLSTGFGMITPFDAKPDYICKNIFPTSCSLTTLITHVCNEIRDAKCIFLGGVGRFKKIKGSAINCPTIYGDDIFQEENQKKYFGKVPDQVVEITNVFFCGILTDFEDPKDWPVGLDHVLYEGASKSLSHDEKKGKDKDKEEELRMPSCHLHGLTLHYSPNMPNIEDISQDMVKDVFHLDTTHCVLTDWNIEIFKVDELFPHIEGISDL